MHKPKRAIHLDCHTMPAVPDVGVDFDAEAFAATLEQARVDFVTVFAKCNLGMAYYPTKVGLPHPSLQCDMLGGMVEACHKRGIAVSAYFNVGLDHEMALRHRDWAILDPQGRVYTSDELDHFFRTMCFGGPWADHLAAMVEEVLTGYEVDGLFLDCWAWDRACVGHECAAAMRDAGQDVLDHDAAANAQNQHKLNFAQRVRKLIDQHRPGINYYLNGIPFDRQLDMCSHLEVESLPGGFWGYMDYPIKVRVMRSLGKHMMRQTGRFHQNWGDFGGLRLQAALDYECYQAVAHGIGCCIGDHLHPRGVLCSPAYERIGSIYRRIEALEPWTDDANVLTDTALVTASADPCSADAVENDALLGATRMLEELQCQFDTLPQDADLSAYDLLVLMDGVRLDDALETSLAKHFERGGAILSISRGGLRASEEQFPGAWPVDFVGDAQMDPGFIQSGALPDMPITIYSGIVRAATRDGADTIADLVRPYFNQHWDGFQGHVYLPPDRLDGHAAAATNKQVAHIAFDVFSDYCTRADTLHRQLVKTLIDAVASAPLCKAGDLPSFARVTLTRQPSRTMVHVLSYIPERRAKTQDIVEEPIVLRDIRIDVKTADVKRVYLAPQNMDVEWSKEGDYAALQIPQVNGYQMIVIEHV